MGTTIEWSKERAVAGRYFVRSAADGYRIAGLVIGGKGRWCVERGGRQWPTVYPSAVAACAALWDARQIPRPWQRGAVTLAAPPDRRNPGTKD